jgi:ribosomal 50S subunit-recycling heat shock protein
MTATATVGEVLDTFKIEAHLAYRSLVFRAAQDEPVTAREIRETLFADEKSIDTFRAHVELCKRRIAAQAMHERGQQLMAEMEAYLPEARALVTEYASRAERFRRLAAACESAADHVRQKLVMRRDEALDAFLRSNNELRLRRSRATEKRMRDLSPAILHLQGFLRSARQFSVEAILKMRADVKALVATVELLRERRSPQLKEAEAELEKMQKELKDQETLPERIREARSQMERLFALQEEASAQQLAWQEVDLDIPPSAIGSPLPAPPTDPTTQSVSFINRNEPVFADDTKIW